MFTGIVETIGTVLSHDVMDTTESGGNGVSIIIGNATAVLGDVQLGDSICTNGVCLTVTEFNDARTSFKVGVSPETLRRSDLGSLKPGSKVNLERAVNASTRMGGHVVQGHVDTIAAITKKQMENNAINFTFQLRDRQYMTYIVEKGFIAVDGTSLTVTNVDYTAAEFSIQMVAYTQEKVVIPLKEKGDTVNIEVDVAGKLIEKQVELVLGGMATNPDSILARTLDSIIEEKIRNLAK
ncbi:riboflavin synthase [Diutina catenulata]